MKKIWSLLLAAVLLLSTLAGCGQQSQEQTGDNAESQGGQTEISLITWRSEDSDVFKEMIADFESKNPDIKVNLEVTSSDITEYYTVLKSRLVSGEGADVIMVHPGPYQKELAEAGSLLDLSDTGLADTLDEGLLVAGQVGDTQYALTQTYNSFAIYYNKDIFDELGLSAPTDYASLVEVCQKCVEGGYMPISVGFGEAWVTEILYEALMCSYADGNDNILHDLETGDAKLTDPVYVSVFGDVVQMVEDGLFQENAIGTTYDSSISLFASGKAAMLMDGTWSIGNLLGMNESLNFGLCRIPSISGADIGPISPSQGICINAKGSHIEESKRFVEYLFTVEAEEMYCNGTKQASTVAGTELDVPEMDMVSELMAGDTALWPDIYVENAQLLSILDALCARLAAGGADLTTELESSQAEIDALIAESK